jgi:hypothetical protein
MRNGSSCRSDPGPPVRPGPTGPTGATGATGATGPAGAGAGVGAVTIITADYTVQLSDYPIYCNNPGGGTKIVTLLAAASNVGRI